VFGVLLTSCGNQEEIKENREKGAVSQDVLDLYRSISFYCLSETCEYGDELSVNELFHYIDTEFNSERYKFDKTTIIGTYKEDGIYIHLKPNGENEFGYDGLVDPNDFSRDDVVKDID